MEITSYQLHRLDSLQSPEEEALLRRFLHAVTAQNHFPEYLLRLKLRHAAVA